MAKALRIAAVVIFMTAILAGTVLAADGSGVRPTSTGKGNKYGLHRHGVMVSTMADGSGIRPD